jgi:hypothetical protein
MMGSAALAEIEFLLLKKLMRFFLALLNVEWITPLNGREGPPIELLSDLTGFYSFSR